MIVKRSREAVTSINHAAQQNWFIPAVVSANSEDDSRATGQPGPDPMPACAMDRGL